MNTLFTKTERFLIRNNQAFVISSNETDSSRIDKDSKRSENSKEQSDDLGPKFRELLSATGIPQYEKTNKIDHDIKKFTK